MGSPATPYLQVVKRARDLLIEFWDPFHIAWASTLHAQ